MFASLQFVPLPLGEGRLERALKLLPRFVTDCYFDSLLGAGKLSFPCCTVPALARLTPFRLLHHRPRRQRIRRPNRPFNSRRLNARLLAPARSSRSPTPIHNRRRPERRAIQVPKVRGVAAAEFHPIIIEVIRIRPLKPRLELCCPCRDRLKFVAPPIVALVLPIKRVPLIRRPPPIMRPAAVLAGDCCVARRPLDAANVPPITTHNANDKRQDARTTLLSPCFRPDCAHLSC